MLLYSLIKPHTSIIPFQSPIRTPCLRPISAAHPVSGRSPALGNMFNAPTLVCVKRSATEG